MGTRAKRGGPNPELRRRKEGKRPSRPERTTAKDLFVRVVKEDPPKWRVKRRRNFFWAPGEGAEFETLVLVIFEVRKGALPSGGHHHEVYSQTGVARMCEPPVSHTATTVGKGEVAGAT